MNASNELEPGPNRLWSNKVRWAGLEMGVRATPREAERLVQAAGWGGFTPG